MPSPRPDEPPPDLLTDTGVTAGRQGHLADALFFGTFKLLPAYRQLMEHGVPVRLSGKALDILILLTERAGMLVSKTDLMNRVWPRAHVEENTLRVHLGALRKVLGDGQAGARYIINDPGRGYTFVAPLTKSREALAANIPAGIPDDRADKLPVPAMRMLGRADAVARLPSLLSTHRLVSLVGPGGIGKTTVAVAFAHVHGAGYPHGVYFLDLAPLADGPAVWTAVATALGLSVRPGDFLKTIADFLAHRAILLVFDNCDHLLDEVTPMIEALLRRASRLNVLVTSREALRADGEWVYQLTALATPAQNETLDLEQALAFPSVALFVERATASWDEFELTAQTAQLAGELCRRLDGNPLAIELAASRVDVFGLQGLAEQFDANLLDLGHYRRTASPRHQTLNALLDWSYQNLTPVERVALAHLAIFKGRFTLDAAGGLLCATAGIDLPTALDTVLNLAAKSLLALDASTEHVHVRLLELTRAFAAQQLTGSGRHDKVALRHAALLLEVFEEASGAWTAMSKREWVAAYVWAADDVRSALDWSFGGRGDALTGARLAAAIWPLVVVHQAFNQPKALAQALAALEHLPGDHTELEIRLHIARASLLQLEAAAEQRIADSSNKAVRLALQTHSPKLLAESVMSLTMLSLAQGDYASAIQNAAQLEAAARSSADAVTALTARRVSAQMWHFAGRHSQAMPLAESVLRHPLPRGRLGGGLGMVDHRVSMRIVLARILWLQGFAGQAAQMCRELIELATQDGPASLCQALSLGACPVALWRGDSALGSRLAGQLQATLADQRRWGGWQPAAGTIPWWVGDADWQASAASNVNGAAMPEALANLLQLDHLITVYPALVDPSAVDRATEESWCAPELLRAQAQRLPHNPGAAGHRAAQDLLLRSLEIARVQGALAWELRSAATLAGLWKHSRPAEGLALLDGVYSRFTEGFETADLQAAAALLAEMRG